MSAVAEKEIVPLSEVRTWASKNGIPVGQRGHISLGVIDQFNKAHRKKVAQSKNPWVKKAAQ